VLEPEPETTPYGYDQIPRALAELRLRAERAVRGSDDDALLSLADELEAEDAEQWPHLWAPAVAIAARRRNRPDSMRILTAAVDGGFSQPELFEGELERHFGAEPAWPTVAAQMRANVPPPPVQLLEWPDPPPTHPVRLDRLPRAREAELRARLPDPAPTGWETAKQLLAWVRRRWEHANDHVEEADAVEILDRAAAGERFACVEYSIVLSQALNACGIPARRVQLMRSDYHVGYGRGHVVSEAWIDELRRWVVLDGQNGAYWRDRETALGVVELQARYASGRGRAELVSVTGSEETDADAWWPYFADASTTGAAWATTHFGPVFQRSLARHTDRLLHDATAAYPDLSRIWIGVCGSGSAPAVSMSTGHPFGRGFVVSVDGVRRRIGVDDPIWPLDLAPGRHDVDVGIVTDYGEMLSDRLSYVVNTAEP
jgi:Transglutaminase-like superfamily